MSLIKLKLYKRNVTLDELDIIAPRIISELCKGLGFDDDELYKAINNQAGRREYELVCYRELEEWVYNLLASRLLKIQNRLVKRLLRLESSRKTLMKAVNNDEVDIYKQDYQKLIDEVIDKYYPEVNELAESLAVRSYLVGYLFAELQVGKSYDKLTDEIVKRFVNVKKLPLTVATAQRRVPLTEYQLLVIKWACDRAASLIRTENSNLREGIKRIVINAEQMRLGRRRLERQLFEQLGGANRNWRRIAATEIAMNANNGFLSYIGDESYVLGKSMIDACSWCKEYIDGKVYRKVNVDKANKDWDKEVWEGKTNYGRSSALYVREVGVPREEWRQRNNDELWKPCIPAHPECFVTRRAPVFTYQGWKEIGSIRYGDLVLTHKGRFRHVIGTRGAGHHKGSAEPYRKPVLKIMVSGGAKAKRFINFTVTPDHPFLLPSGEWRRIGELNVGDTIACLARRCEECGEIYPWLPGSSHFFCSARCWWRGKERFFTPSGIRTLPGNWQVMAAYIDWDRYNGEWFRVNEKVTDIYPYVKERKYAKAPRVFYEPHFGGWQFEFDSITIVKKQEIVRPQGWKLYNLTVDEDESYIAFGMVVHNCRCFWVEISPSVFYVDDKKQMRLRIENEEEWKRWITENNIEGIE